MILSDLYLEQGSRYEAPGHIDFDVAVSAGDLQSPGTRGALWARQDSTSGGKPVVLVPGNHAIYGTCMSDQLAAMRTAAEASNVHVLDSNCLVIGGVRFVGATLRTDFLLPVLGPDGGSSTDVARALQVANERLNDFRLVQVKHMEPPAAGRAGFRQRTRTLRAEDTLAAHWVARDWLARTLAAPHDGPTVVVTHHAPSVGSVHPKHAHNWMTPAFVSNLPSDLLAGADLWIHGHTHCAMDYRRGATRVLSNPRGYRMRDGSFENHYLTPGWFPKWVELPAGWSMISVMALALEAHVGVFVCKRWVG